jgi:hypothetical protein
MGYPFTLFVEVLSANRFWDITLRPDEDLFGSELKICPSMTRVRSRGARRLPCYTGRIDQNPTSERVLLNLMQIDIFARRPCIKASVHFIWLELGCLVNTDAFWTPACVTALI